MAEGCVLTGSVIRKGVVSDTFEDKSTNLKNAVLIISEPNSFRAQVKEIGRRRCNDSLEKKPLV